MTNERKYTAYEIIFQDIKDKILKGHYEPDERLPSVLELCDLYNASDSTIRKSIELLKKNGFVYSIKRVGLFVADFKTPKYSAYFNELEELHKVLDDYKILSWKIDIRRNTHLSTEEKHLVIQRLFYSKGLPIFLKIDHICFQKKK
ncbi:MAG: GntR family transcriptional regulator [Eubacteriaceae bacterium]